MVANLHFQLSWYNQIIRSESSLFRGQRNSKLVSIILVWGSFELNSQMTLLQIRVLATLTMSTFALQAMEEYTGYVNLWSLQQRQALGRRTARWLPLLVRLRRSQNTSSVVLSLLVECHWDSGIEWKDCSLLSMLYCESLQRQIFQRFWITLSHDRRYSS